MYKTNLLFGYKQEHYVLQTLTSN